MIFLDTCICIYSIETISPFHTPTRALLSTDRNARFAISHLVMTECLVGPLKLGNSFALEAYEAFFKRVIVLDLPEAVYRQAAHIRARSGLKLPDALHLACAQYHNCEALWTNDDRLNVSGGSFVRALFT